MIMRHPLQGLLFIVLLCDPISAALQCTAQLGTGPTLAHCQQAMDRAFSFEQQLSAAELAENRVIYLEHPSNELQKLPRSGVFATCAVGLTMSQPTAVGNWKHLKEEMTRLITECVGGHATGGAYEVDAFRFVVMSHRFVASRRMAAEEKRKTATAPPIVAHTNVGRLAPAAKP